jgi:LysM repeat protein
MFTAEMLAELDTAAAKAANENTTSIPKPPRALAAATAPTGLNQDAVNLVLGYANKYPKNPNTGGTWAGWCALCISWLIDSTVGFATPSLYRNAEAAGNNSQPLNSDFTQAPVYAIHYWHYSGGGHVAIQISERDDNPALFMASAINGGQKYGDGLRIVDMHGYNANTPSCTYRGWSMLFSGGQPNPWPVSPKPEPATYITIAGDTPGSIRAATTAASADIEQLLLMPGQAVPLAQPAPAQVIHTVAKGQGLIRVAEQYGITLAQLLALNPTVKPNQTLYVGDQLRVA